MRLERRQAIILVAMALVAAAASSELARRGTVLLYFIGALAGAATLALFVRFFWVGLLLIFVVRASLDHLKSGGSGASPLSPASVIGGLFLAASFLWLLQRRRTGRLRPLSTLARALLILAGACVIGSAGSLTPFSSFNSSLRILSSALMFVVLEQLFGDDPSRILLLLGAVFTSMIGPALVAMTQLIGNKPVIPAYGPPLAVGRVEGTFVHPNAFATYLVLVLPLALAVLPRVHRRVLRVVTWGVLGGSTALLLFTYARAAWAAALVAVLIVGFLQDRRIVAVVLGGSTVALLAVPSIAARLGDLFSSHPYATTADPNSLSWRFSYWAKVLPLITRSPVTGIGLDVVQKVESDGLPPHDVYIQALVESGVVGLLALVNVVVAAWRSFQGCLQRDYDPLGRSLLVGSVAAGMGFLVQTFTENLYTQAVSQWYVLVPVAWAVAVRSTDAATWSSSTWFSPTPSPRRRGASRNGGEAGDRRAALR